MKKYSSISIKLLMGVCTLCLLFSFGCNDDVDLPAQPLEQYMKVYMPQAVNNPVNLVFSMSDTGSNVIYGADYGGPNAPKEDIKVQFDVNAALIDSFNTANGTDYPILPEGTYAFEETSAIIAKGALSTAPLHLHLTTMGDGGVPPLKTFILPVQLSGASFTINPALQTTFYVITVQPDRADYPDYDKSGWKIIDFSSQEINGEHAPATNAIDGDPATFWHSQWSGAAPVPPHYITIDLGEIKPLHGVELLARQADGSGKPQNVTIEVSDDNVHWSDAADLVFQNTQNLQQSFLSGFTEGRYVKVIVNTAFNASYTQIAEFNLF